MKSIAAPRNFFRLILALGSLLVALAFVEAANAAPCPGADSCPWIQVDTFGDVGNGEFRSPYAIGSDAGGNLYVLDQDMDRVKKLDASGAFLSKWGGEGSAEGRFSLAMDLAVDAAGGGVYVADSDNNRIQKFDTAGNFVSAWGWGVSDGSPAYQICTGSCQAGSVGSGTGQLNFPTGIATDGLHVYVADDANGRIQKFGLDGTPVGEWQVPNAQSPERVTVTGGKVYVSTRSNTVWRFDTNGAPDSSWDGDGVLGSLGSGAGQFNHPEGLAVDASGVYVADARNNRIQKFDLSGKFVTEWGTRGVGDGEFFEPVGLLAASGSLWVTDSSNHRLQRFGATGAHQLTVGEPLGGGAYYFPGDVATTASGHAYVADRSGHDIQELDASGHTILRWSTGLSAPFSVTPTANGVYAPETINHVSLYDPAGGLVSQFGSTGSGQGQLSSPSGSAADAAGNLYVAESSNNRVQKFDPAGAPLALFGSLGSGDGQLKNPQDVAVDSAGNLYVADSGNHRIEKFSPTGDFVSKWGSFGSNDGQFAQPSGVAVDESGHVFVSDTGNDRIQEFDGNGTFLTKWGTHGNAPGELSGPMGLSVDSAGAIWVADRKNHRIVRFSRTGAPQGTGSAGGTPPPVTGGGDRSGGSEGAAMGPAPVDTTAPRVRMSGQSPQNTRIVRRRGLALRIASSERASASLRAVITKRAARQAGVRPATIGHLTTNLAGGGPQVLRLRLTAQGRRALLRTRKLRIVVREFATDQAGNRSSSSLAITVTR